MGDVQAFWQGHDVPFIRNLMPMEYPWVAPVPIPSGEETHMVIHAPFSPCFTNTNPRNPPLNPYINNMRMSTGNKVPSAIYTSIETHLLCLLQKVLSQRMLLARITWNHQHIVQKRYLLTPSQTTRIVPTP